MTYKKILHAFLGGAALLALSACVADPYYHPLAANPYYAEPYYHSEYVGPTPYNSVVIERQHYDDDHWRRWHDWDDRDHDWDD